MSDENDIVNMASEEFAKSVGINLAFCDTPEELPDVSEAEPNTLYFVPKVKAGVDPKSHWDLWMPLKGYWANLSAVDKAGLVLSVNAKLPAADGHINLDSRDIIHVNSHGEGENSVSTVLAGLLAKTANVLPATETQPGYYSLLDILDLNLPINTFINGETPITDYDVVDPDSDATSGQVADAADTYAALSRLEGLINAIDLSGLVPTSRTVNGKALSADVVLTGEDIPAFDGSSQTVWSAISSAGSDAAQAVTKADAAVGTANGVAGAFTQHADNTTIHVTAEDKATWNGKQSALSDAQLANIAAVSSALAFDATHSYAVGDPVVYNGTLYTFTTAHTGAWTGSDVSAVDIIARIAGKLDKSGGTMTGNLTVHNEDGPWAEIKAETEENSIAIRQRGRVSTLETDDDTYVIPRGGGTFAMTDDIPYTLGTPIVIDTASSEVIEGETVNYGAATLANRTANIVQVTAATALDELRITFPASVSGKVRDFGLRVEVGTGSAALTAPALVPVAPTGETIKLENADGAIPALADGAATAKGVTLLYFSETAPGVFVVKGEQVEEVA